MRKSDERQRKGCQSHKIIMQIASAVEQAVWKEKRRGGFRPIPLVIDGVRGV
jgi:hypothetical protein